MPRIGTEVLVSFEQGDLDRPLIIGSLHNGQDLPPFQAGVQSPVDHPGVIAGIHTRVLMAAGSEGNNGYNQLLFDDAPGALGAQLASSTQASQLNLGALVGREPGTAKRGAPRGEGAELVSDAWVALRAGQGALLSATARPGAAGGQLDAQEALAQLEAAGELAQRLSEAATAQGSAALTSPQAISDFRAIVSATTAPAGGGEPVPAFSRPVLLQETPASAVLASPASLVSYASESLHVVAQDEVHVAAGKTLELASGRDTALFTHAGGISAIAANGPVSIQAQTTALSLLADQSVQVTSTDGAIEISAQTKIVLQAGECAITLEGGDITFAMPGTFSVKGAQQALGGGGSGQVALPVLPTGRMLPPQSLELTPSISEHFDEAFVLIDPLGNPMPKADYQISTPDGPREGVTGPDGDTPRLHSRGPETVEFELRWYETDDE